MTKKKVGLLLFLLGACLILGRFCVTGSVLGGDAVYYFLQMRSVVLDRDLDFRNEYAYFHQEKSRFTGNSKIPQIPEVNTNTGRPPNKYPIGVALLLIPFYVLGHAISLLLTGVGVPVSCDGYGSLYQLITALGSLCYGLLGIKVLRCLGERWFQPNVSLWGTASIVLATPMIYYMTMEPLMSHTLSMVAVTLLVWYWLHVRTSVRACDWLVLGGLSGISALIRYQDGLFILMPVLDLISQGFSRERKTTSVLGALFFLSLGAFILFSLQLMTNKVLCGSFFQTGYASEGFPYWRSPKFVSTLFSKECGLILWSPILALALIGLGCFAIKYPRPGIFMGIGFLIQCFLVSSWSTPSQGDSFGNRMLLNSSVFYALGLMQIYLSAQKSPELLRWLLRGSGLLIIMNAVVCALYCFRIIGHPY